MTKPEKRILSAAPIDLRVLDKLAALGLMRRTERVDTHGFRNFGYTLTAKGRKAKEQRR